MSLLRRVLLSTLIVCVAARPLAADVSAPPKVRPTSPLLRSALLDGASRSPTLRALLQRIEHSNVIVHVSWLVADVGSDGATRFVGASASHRFVQVTIRDMPPGDQLIALLAHELRHVVEVADAPWVVDASTFAALYREIGRARCRAPRYCFDTKAAITAGYDVLRELRRGPARHPLRHAEER